jgi:arylsulfatase A-like enzyme
LATGDKFASDASSAKPSHPNIVFIISDDHRWDCLGVVGNPSVKTPQLDELAQKGVYFPQATILTPQCSPSRATLLTGIPPHQSGWYSNQTQNRQVHEPDGFRNYQTVPGLLQKNGYRTVLVGKWHLTPEPWKVGFTDVRTWLPGGGGPYKDVRLAHGNSRETTTTPGFLQDVFGQDCAAFIRSPQAKEKPFFLWLALTAPHTPLQPNPEHLEALYAVKPNTELAPPGFTRGTPDERLTSFTLYGGRRAARGPKNADNADDDEPTTSAAPGQKPRRTQTDWHHYYAAISSADEQVGRIREALKDAGLAENTIIVFLGDNGLMRGSRGWTGKVLPYEESVRVPMIIYMPKGQAVHGKSTAAVSSLDLPPTFLKWAGVKAPEGWTGRDLSQVLEKEGAKNFNSAFCEFADNVSKKFGAVEYRLIRTTDAKLIQWRDPAKGVEFFDLKQDPRELHNEASNPKYADVIKSMRAQLEHWQKRTTPNAAMNTKDVVSGEGED